MSPNSDVYSSRRSRVGPVINISWHAKIVQTWQYHTGRPEPHQQCMQICQCGLSSLCGRVLCHHCYGHFIEEVMSLLYRCLFLLHSTATSAKLILLLINALINDYDWRLQDRRAGIWWILTLSKNSSLGRREMFVFAIFMVRSSVFWAMVIMLIIVDCLRLEWYF